MKSFFFEHMKFARKRYKIYTSNPPFFCLLRPSGHPGDRRLHRGRDDPAGSDGQPGVLLPRGQPAAGRGLVQGRADRRLLLHHLREGEPQPVLLRRRHRRQQRALPVRGQEQAQPLPAQRRHRPLRAV